jgi:hypothetical protein
MHGLYLSRKCTDITQLSHELLGLHCWFHRNVAFSALIRGADLAGWKHVLTKTWIHHALHGVTFDDLPTLLALNSGDWRLGEPYKEIADKVIGLMEDGIYSRAEMRLLFAGEYERYIIDMALSPWGGIFCELARLGKVAFRDMTSRDFDLIDAELTQTFEEVLPELFRRFLTAYGPATLADAAWFFGLQKERKKELFSLDLDEYLRFEYNKGVYYAIDDKTDMDDIPALTLLSGFDPLIVSYMERSAVLPPEYKKAVVTKSGICLPTIAINGQVAGLWNIKNRKSVIEFFTEQPQGIHDTTYELVERIRWQTTGIL